MKRIIGRISFLFILILSLGLISCDSWMTGDNFFDQIADEVKYANAEKIKVFIRYPNRSMGETSPNGSSNQKVDIPFTVTAVDSSNYAFYKWAAFSTADGEFNTTQQHNILYTNETAYQEYKDKELGTDEVVFEDPNSAVTTVRILHERNDVFIMPICVRRPYIQLSRPANGDTGVVKNASIILSFSSPMNKADLITHDTVHNCDTYSDKIAIQPYTSTFTGPIFGTLDSNLNGEVMTASLTANDTVLTISLPDGAFLPVDSFIMVSVSGEVRDYLGNIMGNDAQISFRTCDDTDTERPKVIDLEAGLIHLRRNESNTGDNSLIVKVNSIPRAGKTLNVRAFIGDKAKATETTFSDNVNMIYYQMIKIQNVADSIATNGTIGLATARGELGYAGSVNSSVSPKAQLESNQLTGTTFTIKDERDYGYDGLWYLVVWGTDTVGNEGRTSSEYLELSTAASANPPESKMIYFIRDTQAPNISPSQVIATSTGDSAPYGWFNSSTISNITIKPSSTSPIKDSPNVNNRYKSDKVWWTFYMGDNPTTWSDSVTMEDNTGTGGWGAWHEVTNGGDSLSDLIGSTLDPSSMSEGSQNLYVKFRDDVGNISDLVSLDAIKFDGTAPTLGNLSWTSKNSSVAPGIADSNILGNQQLVVPFTENLSGIKKIQITVVNPDGEEYPTPFRNTDFAIRTSPSGELLPGSVDATDGTYYIFNTPVLTTFTSLYIDNLKISESSTLAEGNYTVKVKLFDAALNETAEKTISLYADRTNPEITEMYFDGVKNDSINNSYAGSILLNPENTYTTSSTGNTLFIKMTETGSGIQKIDIPYGFATNPYAPSGSASQIPRGIIPTTSTKLFVSTNGGTSYTEVPCSVDTASKCLTIAQDNAIRGTDVLLKITNITLSGTPGTVEALVGAVLRDFAGHANSAVKYAAVAEDYSAPEVSSVSIGDSGKHLNGSNALVNDTGISAQSGYTDTPIVNIVARLNEYATDAAVTTCSGLRKIVLEGASFTSNTEIEVCQNISVSYNNYPVNSWRYIHSLGTKDSVEECPFAYSIPTGDTTSGGGFYIVDDHTAVLRIPLNITADYPFSIRYVKLDDTASDGEKTVKISFFDTARQLETTASNQKTMKIKYCATPPEVKVRTGTVTNPANITSANITALVPVNNGLQAYIESSAGNPDTVRVHSWDTVGNRNGARTSPAGNGVYSGSEKRQYFDLDITANSEVSLYKYAWSIGDSASGTEIPVSSVWVSVNSLNKVDVMIPDVLPLASQTAKYLWLHVADQAGNVTTTRMSNCKWLNSSNHGSSEWPKRSSATGRDTYSMVDGQYYLEEYGLTNGSSGDPKYRLVLPANASGTKKVYFPTEWFTPATSTNGVPIYGCALGNGTSLGTGHSDCTLAKHDENGPYLELPESFYKSSTPNAYFYVYDAVGIDLTAYIVTEVDATPPVLELGVLRDSGEYPSGTSSGMKTKWEGSSYVNSTKTRFNVESDGSRHIRETVSSTQQSTTKGASETDPIVLYVDTNNPEIMLWTNSMDVLKFTCSVNGAAASEIAIDQTTSTSTDLNTNYVRISPTLTETGAMYKFSAVDKGANESSIYIKAYWDNAGPTVSLTNATNIYTNPTDHKNYIASINEATASTATITITDQLVGFGSGEKTLTYNSAKLLDYLTVDNTANTLKLKTTYQADALGNANTASISYNGSSSWELDNAAPTIQIVPGSMTGCATIDGYLYISASNSNAKLKLNITEYGSGLASGSIQDQEEITLSNYVSDGVVKIPNPSNSNSKPVIDNVGNGYTTANPYLPGLSIRLDDKSPNPPASLVDASSTGGTLIRDGTTITYNGSTTAITLNITTPADPNNTDGTAGSGVAGYTASSGVTVTATNSTSITIAPVAGTFPSTVTIKSKDGVGNVSSSGLTVTLIKDADSPEVSIASLVANTGKTYNGNPNYFYYNDNGSYAKVKLSIQDNSGGSGLASSSWGNNTQINISDYLNSSNNTIEITNPVGNVKIVDNVGNTETYSLKYNEKPIIYDADGPDTPTISAIAVTGSGAKYHQDENTIYYNNKTSTITITPSADDNPGGCGVAGYSTSPTGTTSGTIVLNSTIPSYVDIYAIDNLGNASSSYLRVSLVMDDTPPSVSISEITGGKTYPSGSTMFYRDEGMNTVKATLSVLDNVSGVPTSGSYTTGTTLDVSAQLNSDGKIAIENNKVFDNVGNTQAYALMYTVGATSYTFKNDATPPTAPSGFKVYSTTGGSSSDYYVTGDPDANGFYPSTSKIYYNANVTGITLQFNGSTDTGGSGVKGYAASYSDTIPPTVALDLTASSITVFAFDNVGNKSTSGFTVQYAKDADAPTFEMATPGSSVTSAKAPNGFTVNTYTSGTTQLSFTISDVSGLAAYALVHNEGDGNDYSGYTGPLDWINTTGTSITLTLPDTSHYNTNYMLLLKDKLGNVTKPDGTGTSAYSAAAVKNGSNGWWCSEPATKSFSAGSKIDGNNLEVELNGVDFAVSTIAVTATGVTGISGGKVKFKDTDGSYKEIECSYNGGIITISGGNKYLSYDGSIKFTLTGGEGLALPTSIKLNDSVEITTIGSLSFFAGFNRFRFGETDATEIRAANTQEAPVRLTRNISVGDFFAAMDSPAYAESDNRVAFSVGKNMDAVVEGKKQQETVTVQEEFGYNNVASDAENLPLQNLSWHAPDGPILEDAGQEEEALALNLSPEFNSSNQVLSASDAGNPQEESHGWNPALVVSLLAMLALGLVALCVRKRPVR